MPLDIAIVGGGIGGLTAAAGLAHNGHNVIVYERTDVVGGVGFAFRITANSVRCLDHLGIDTTAGGACTAERGTQYDGQGNVKNRTEEHSKESKAGSKSVFAYRPQVRQQLWDVAVQNGAQMKVGVKVKTVDISASSLTLEDGQRIEADLIIGADGVHSVVRPRVLGGNKPHPIPTLGRNAFRFMIPMHLIQKDDLLSTVYSETDTQVVSWVEGDRFLITYPVDFGKQINVVCTHPQELSDRKIEESGSGATIDYEQRVSAETALDIYSGFEPRARRVLELADPEGFRIWKLVDIDEVERWSLNRTVMLGDCCHAVLPFGFSGASMAIEDATVLYTLLSGNTQLEGLSARIALYESIRRPRVARVREASRDIGKGKWSKDFGVEYLKFLSSYDAVEDAARHLSTLELSENNK